VAAPPPDEFRDDAQSPWRLPIAYGSAAALQAIGTVAAPLLAGFSFTLAALVLTNPERIRAPDQALILFIAAGLLLTNAVQASAWARRWDVTPGDLLGWWPDFNELSDHDRGLIYEEQRTHATRHLRWARVTQATYDGGILCLLAGVALLVWPPHGWSFSSARTLAALVALCGLLAECVWVVFSVVMARRKY
jgi:hypothetical protein